MFSFVRDLHDALGHDRGVTIYLGFLVEVWVLWLAAQRYRPSQGPLITMPGEVSP